MTDQDRTALAEEIATAVREVARPRSCACNGQATMPPSDRADWSGLAASIDYALDRHYACQSEFDEFIASARSGGFRSVFVPPRWTAAAVRSLRGTPTKVASLVGQSGGASLTPAKCAEAECLLRLGADEVWTVADTGSLRSGDLDAAFIDIRAVAELAQCRGRHLHVILELSLLDQRQAVSACVVAKLAGATGAAVWMTDRSAAGIDEIRLMRNAVGGELEVLAAGSIATTLDARKVLNAGADRIMVSHAAADRE